MPANKKTVKALEQYYADMQRLQIALRSDENNPIRAEVLKSLRKKSLYIGGTEAILFAQRMEKLAESLWKQSGARGKMLAGEALEDWLLKEEAAILRTKQLGALRMLNNRQAAQRLNVFKKQMQKEVTVLRADMDIFVEQAIASGRTKAQALEELMRVSLDEQGVIAGFEKQASKVAAEAVMREAQSSAIAEYRQSAKPDEPWVWIAVSTKPCPDCQARAGTELLYERWVEIGLPGTGRTICESACRCQLVPRGVAESEFGEVRSFTWDKEKLVLTTFAEARVFKADKNRSPLAK